MPRGMPRVQRQHQPTLWKLRSLRLLRLVGRLLQRDMHLREFGSKQLRRLRQRLPCIDAHLQPGDMRQLPAGPYSLQRCLHRPSGRQTQLRRVWQCMR